MNSSDGMNTLSDLCKGKDWFFDIGTDSIGRYVVYVKYMNMETMTLIPNSIGDKQVLVHFAGSLTSKREQFINDSNARKEYVPISIQKPLEVDILDELSGDTEEKSTVYLQNELERLEKVCGSFTLQDVFYEIHDGKNAVTNMSARYPEVRTGLERLFDQYGFDVIYEELDG